MNCLPQSLGAHVRSKLGRQATGISKLRLACLIVVLRHTVSLLSTPMNCKRSSGACQSADGLEHAEGSNASRSWKSNCCSSREGYWIKDAVVAVLLFLESTMRLRTIFPKTAARRSKYWISAGCLAPAFWPAASTNASTAFNRSARAPKLLGSLTALAQASSANFAINTISDAIISVPPIKA
jgi:hypothetical protein